MNSHIYAAHTDGHVALNLRDEEELNEVDSSPFLLRHNTGILFLADNLFSWFCQIHSFL